MPRADVDDGEILYRYFKLGTVATLIHESFLNEGRDIPYSRIVGTVRDAGLRLKQGGNHHHFRELCDHNTALLEKRVSDLYLLIGPHPAWAVRILKREGTPIGLGNVSKIWRRRHGGIERAGTVYDYTGIIASLILGEFKDNGRSYPGLVEWMDEWAIPYTETGLKRFLSGHGYKMNGFDKK